MSSRAKRVARLTVLLVLGLAACGNSTTVVRTAGQADGFIDDVIRGADPDQFRIADDAGRIALAAGDDAGPLTELSTALGQSEDGACFVIALINGLGEAAPQSTAQLTLGPADLSEVNREAQHQGVPQTLTARTVEAAQTMAQSTFVEAADFACDVPAL